MSERLNDSLVKTVTLRLLLVYQFNLQRRSMGEKKKYALDIYVSLCYINAVGSSKVHALKHCSSVVNISSIKTNNCE